MKPVERSSTIDSVGYEPAHQLLKIKFKSGGTYHFEGVPAAEHQKLITAPNPSASISTSTSKARLGPKSRKTNDDR